MSDRDIQIGGGFTEGELKFSSFWVKHRLEITRGGYIALIAANVFLWGFVAWTLIDAFVISYPRESKITTEIAQNQLTLNALDIDAPKTVDAADVIVLPTTDSRYDLSVDLNNPNPQWWAEFNYHFVLSGQETPLRNGYIMPQSKSTMTELGFKPSGRGGASAQFVVENIRWHRLDPRQVSGAYKDYELSHFNVAFENVKYDRDLVIGSKTVGRTSFDIVNHGSFGYWNMDLVIRVYRGSTIAAMNRITLTQLRPGESRHVELDWFDAIPSVTKTEIIPIINFLDQTTYLPSGQF